MNWPLFIVSPPKVAGLRRLHLMERLLFLPFAPVSFDYKGLTLRSGLARGGGGVVYRGTFAGRGVIVKTVSFSALRKNLPLDAGGLDKEYEIGRKLRGIAGVPEYLEKVRLEVECGNRRDLLSIPLLIIEYLDSIPLHTFVAGRRDLRFEEKLVIFRKLLQILTAVHGAGTVHKDINPANILIGHPLPAKKLTGVWLIDFGASGCNRRFSRQYGAPEQQIPLVFGEVGKSCDIFSLGLVIYELFEGVLPFSPQAAPKVLAEEEELPLPFRRCHHAGIQQVLTRMLRKDPDQRSADIAEILKTVETFCFEK